MAPDPKLLASVVTKILYSGISEGSIVVRHSGETTRALIVSKAVWCLAVQAGKCLSHSFLVSSLSTAVESVRWGRNMARLQLA